MCLLEYNQWTKHMHTCTFMLYTPDWIRKEHTDDWHRCWPWYCSTGM